MNVGLIGQVYTHMADMPIDEHRLLRATGRMLARPEVEEIENAYHRVTATQLENMVHQLREMYDVDGTVTDEQSKFAAQAAVAFDEVIPGPILRIGNPNCRVRSAGRSTSSWMPGASKDHPTTSPSAWVTTAARWRPSPRPWGFA